MDPVPLSPSLALASLPDLGAPQLLGFAGILLAALAVVAWFAYTTAREVVELRRSLAPLGRLEAVEQLLGRMAERESTPELRRVEHVLVDIRDGQRRFEERIVRLTESMGQASGAVVQPQSGGAAALGSSLTERVVTRLLAMGFERIEVLSSGEEQAALMEGEGEMLVEARRAGSPHKGRVRIEHGAIVDVQLRSAYQAFP